MNTPAILTAAIVGVVGLGIGASIGASTINPETVAETIEVTPQGCVDLVDDSEAFADITSEALLLAADGFDYSADYDIAGLQETTDAMVALAPDIEEISRDFWASHTACAEATR